MNRDISNHQNLWIKAPVRFWFPALLLLILFGFSAGAQSIGPRAQETLWELQEAGEDARAKELERELSLLLRYEDISRLERIGDIYQGEIQGVPVLVKFSRSQMRSFNELFVYQLDRALGLQRVPMIVRREFAGRGATVQLRVSGAQAGEIDFRSHAYTDERLYLLDYLTGQRDRHGQNWLRTPSGRIVAIDNELIAGVEEVLREELGLTEEQELRPAPVIPLRRIKDAEAMFHLMEGLEEGRLEDLFASFPSTLSWGQFKVRAELLIQAFYDGSASCEPLLK